MSEFYVSVDVETDGPHPGRNSLLSIGAASFHESKGEEPLSSFHVNLVPLDTGEQDPSTMSWWRDHEAAWKCATKDPILPSIALSVFHDWVSGQEKALSAVPVFVAYPLGFDMHYVYWYFREFGVKWPFGAYPHGIDIRSYAMGALGKSYIRSQKEFLPTEWTKEDEGLAHDARFDAIQQGKLFMRMRG